MKSKKMRQNLTKTTLTYIMRCCTMCIMLTLFSIDICAEDGSQLWLRYAKSGSAVINAPQGNATIDIAVRELRDYWRGASLTLELSDDVVDDEGFRISGTHITARKPIGLLYAAYHLLRVQAETGQPMLTDCTEKPALRIRMLNHWDNPDLTIERGYAGKSIFKWEEIDGESGTMSSEMQARLTQYARACASIGINGTVLNNVNASPFMLARVYINKVKVIADALRPYGIRVFLSANFASPMALGETKTADPANKKVKTWWMKKAKQIYQLIPDFGGLLVKANSEGQPGPGDYGRSHSDGANVLADALKPYGGLVIWRSFVYGANHKGEDRVKQAVSEFAHLDGQFRENVILQSKNGPLDFQPREPYAPIFDNIKHTDQMAELQITQEYTGQSKHLVYLATMWKEFFSFVNPRQLRGIAGVANIGDDVNWCGHPFSQANWYAFGRLAWNPELSAESIAEEWLTQTFSREFYFVKQLTSVMMASREACVDYMMPLGLHHLFKFDHHYGPEPDGFKAEYPIEWCPVYYLQADSIGIGFNRSSTGTGATSQYRSPYNKLYDDVKTCPEEYLLWFHHVAWDYKMRNGRTLWDNLQQHYCDGVEKVKQFKSVWNAAKPFVDAERWQHVDTLLDVQYDNACEWKDTCLKYFKSLKDK